MFLRRPLTLRRPTPHAHTPQELANCLVVFDDIDAIRDKKIKKVVTDLCDELQVVGRHDNTWVIRTSHLFRNWGATKASLAESNKTIFFPQVTSKC